MANIPEVTKTKVRYYLNAHYRLLIALAVSLTSFLVFRSLLSLEEITLVTWICFALSLILPEWIVILTAKPDDMRKIARMEDSSRAFLFLFVLSASVISLMAVIILLRSGDKGSGTHFWHIGLALGSVIVSWWLVHTVFTLRYAHMYYDTDKKGEKLQAGGLNFPDEDEPDYMDFVYYSFNLGVAFQVSDVSISSRSIRRITWIHSLIGFAYNTTIVALTINTISELISK